MELRPQPGAQTLFASNGADICIFAGQTGSGKTVSLAIEHLRWIDRPGYAGTTYRRLSKQLFDSGGMYSVIEKLGRPLGVKCVRSPIPTATARSGATITLQHLQLGLATAEGQDGKGFDQIQFDELTHYDADTFWYLTLTRNRATDETTKIKPYVRASTMAEADTFVHELVKPWLHKDGWPDFEQSGRVRWIVRNPTTNLFQFFESAGDARDFADAYKLDDPRLKLKPLSLSIVHAVTEENLVLMRANPDYAQAQGNLTRLERLRKQGNWEARAESAGMFDRQWYRVLDDMPRDDEILFSCRGWDKASSKPSEDYPDPDWTRGVRLDLMGSGCVLVSDVVSCRERPGQVQDLISRTAKTDGPKVTQSFFRDPAQAGVQDEYHTRNLLSLVPGCGPVEFTPTSKDKITFASPASAYADKRERQTAGMAILRRSWNADYFKEVEEFPREKNALGQKNHDDQIDAQSAAWLKIQDRLPSQIVGTNQLEMLMAGLDLDRVRGRV